MSRKVSTTPVPSLTKEERAHALELAMASRQRAVALKRRLKSGELALDAALDEPDAQRIKVEALLRSLPRVGPARAQKIMAATRIARSRRVSGIGKTQRKRLLSLMEEVDRGGFGAI